MGNGIVEASGVLSALCDYGGDRLQSIGYKSAAYDASATEFTEHAQRD